MLAATVVFVAAVIAVTLTLRGRLRKQLLGRDAAVLYPVTLFEIQRARSSLVGLYMEDDLLGSLLEVSHLDGVVAIRIFDERGEFLDAAPESFLRGGISPEDYARLLALQPVSHFHPQARLSDYFIGAAQDSNNSQDEGTASTLPLLEVLVPIHESGSGVLMGIAQYMLNGQPLMAEFRELDRNLMRQAGLALLAGLILGGGLLGWAFWRLQRSNRLLLERSTELARANEELLRSARTSAIGAVTAHLLHGLKNPLSAVQLYVEERRRSGETASDDGLEDAGEATRRMHRMIQEAVSVLQQPDTSGGFELTAAEICEVVVAETSSLARARDVTLKTSIRCDGAFDHRRANLLILALLNLVQNAIEASESGTSVELECSQNDTLYRLRVRDHGHGLPPQMRENPFTPVRSSKEGGSGVGLAITHELVRHIGADLQLEATSADGSTFAIEISRES